MAQYLHETYPIGATATIIPTDPVKTNLAARETAGVACTVKYTGRNGTGKQDVGAYGFLMVEGVDVSQLKLEGNGATLVIDMSYPELIDPKYLGAPGGSSTNLAKETGGNLDAISANLSAIKVLLGAGLPSALSAGGGVKVHDVGS